MFPKNLSFYSFLHFSYGCSPVSAYKRLLANDHDWDYGYLIALEKKKLQRMHNYMKHEGHLENNDVVVRETPIFILTYFYPFINQISEENL